MGKLYPMIYWERRSKYGSTSTTYNGITYHSKKEAAYAKELDLMIKANEIQSWERQVRIPLDVNGFHICNYICDFKVTNNDGTVEYHEVKGFETDIYRMKRKLLEALYPNYKYVVIK